MTKRQIKTMKKRYISLRCLAGRLAKNEATHSAAIYLRAAAEELWIMAKHAEFCNRQAGLDS